MLMLQLRSGSAKIKDVMDRENEHMQQMSLVLLINIMRRLSIEHSVGRHESKIGDIKEFSSTLRCKTNRNPLTISPYVTL